MKIAEDTLQKAELDNASSFRLLKCIRRSRLRLELVPRSSSILIVGTRQATSLYSMGPAISSVCIIVNCDKIADMQSIRYEDEFCTLKSKHFSKI